MDHHEQSPSTSRIDEGLSIRLLSFWLDRPIRRRGTRISCGYNHTVFLDARGNVYTCGLGEDGQLGHDDTKDRRVPTKVIALEDKKIVSVSCGSYHTAFLDNQGNVYTCGWGDDGPLGHGDEQDKLVPTKVSI